MDFLRIRQRARERVAAAVATVPLPVREAAPEAPPPLVAVPALPPQSAAPEVLAPAAPTLGPADVERIEDALRAELTATRAAVLEREAAPLAPAPAPPRAPAPFPAARAAPHAEARAAPQPPAAAPPAPPADPLDAFFWREDEVAPGVLALAEPVAPRAVEAPEPLSEWLTFALGAEDYGIEIAHVREILKAPAITDVPRAPRHVLGIIMVRGEVIAVFDPRRRLGLPEAAPGPRARVVVCDVGEGPRGLLVDGVWQVVRLPASAIEPRPGGIGGAAADYIAALGRDRDRLYVLLDLPTLLRDGSPARPEATP
jgi:purine-binding chemotaxis protein CheW